MRLATLLKVDEALGWARGTSNEILLGATIPVFPSSSEKGAAVAKVSEEEVNRAIAGVMVTATDSMTAAEIREVAGRVTEELKRLGLL